MVEVKVKSIILIEMMRMAMLVP